MDLLILGCDASACCCACTGCFCWTSWKICQAALQAVRDIQARQPCPQGLRCLNCETSHLDRFSHPDDADYGFSIRVHGGTGEFSTIRQCFNFMDPYQQGYVKELAALRELLNHVRAASGSGSKKWKDSQVREIWKRIDTDGNGYISFPEFVEWASMRDPAFKLPVPVGIIGEKGRSGEYQLCCTVAGCDCKSFWPAVEGDRFCGICHHKYGQHAASPMDQILAVVPPKWCCKVASKTLTELISDQALTRCSPTEVAALQRLMDASKRQVWTRDRGKANKVPSGYEVVRAERNENVRLWLKYSVKKTLMLEAIEDKLASGRLTELEQREVLTSAEAAESPLFAAHHAEAEHNEWYLWHGASSKGIKSIALQEFKQLHAGCNTGTLYGAGTYLSDSCTKADEYAREEPEGEDAGLCCLLLCRVMGGNVLYTDEREPDGAVLAREVLEGPYDCVLGDREKCRGTFKEIVVYESSQAYPEFLVYYRRLYA